MKKNEFVVLKIGDREIQLPVVTGTEGEKAFDITQLRKQTGFITIDPGFMNTGACYSSITFVDGERGILRYRGTSTMPFEVSSAIALRTAFRSILIP